MKKKLLNLTELFELSSVIKKQLGNKYDYDNLKIVVILNEKELKMIDEELFFRNNPTASKKDFVHADIVTANINNINYVFNKEEKPDR